MKNKFLAPLTLTTLLLLSIPALTARSLAHEVQLPQVSLSLGGPGVHDALLEVLKLENIPRVLEKFKPIQKNLEWTPHPVVTEGSVSRLHLSFQHVASHADGAGNASDGGVWGYFKGKVINTVSTVTQSAFGHGDFMGEVTHTELFNGMNTRTPNTHGYRLDMDLGQSSLSIFSLITHLSIEIILENLSTSETPWVDVTLLTALQPGVMFPGIQDAYVATFVDNLLEAWCQAIREAVLEQQGRLASS